MKLPGMAVVKEEMSMIDAQNVAAFLQAQGLAAIVSADDAGGTIPALDETRFAQVLVPEADAEQARSLIESQAGAGSSSRPRLVDDDEGDEGE